MEVSEEPFLKEAVMSVAHLLPVLQALPREDKLRVVQFLVAELALEEGVEPIQAQTEYPVWSPHHAYDAAETLLGVLNANGSGQDG